MPVAPTHAEIYARAVAEGNRRLAASGLELVANGFNAGFTIVFGVALLGVLRGLVEPRFGAGVAEIAGALGFSIGVAYLVVSRAELFTENFFDPIASLFDHPRGSTAAAVCRLWVIVLSLNLVGAFVLVVIFSIDGVLDPQAEAVLRVVAAEMAEQAWGATFGSALIGGALVTLLSMLLQAVDSTAARMAAALLVGLMLGVGPFMHVVVSAAHFCFGGLNGLALAIDEVTAHLLIAAVGNVVGGVGFVSLVHLAQARGASTSESPDERRHEAGHQRDAERSGSERRCSDCAEEHR